MSAEEVDEFLSHHGVKGQKWGVRRRGRITRTVNVGKGKGSTLDKIRVGTYANPADLLRTGSFKKAAARKGKRMVAREDRMATGNSKVRDILISVGTSRASDILPSVTKGAQTMDKKSAAKKITNGKAFALALPIAAMYVGTRVAQYKKAAQ